MSEKGWTFQARSIEIETCQLASVFNGDIDGNDIGDATMKLFNASDAEITVQATADTDCVRTELYWEPIYDLEILSGFLQIITSTSNDMRVFVRAIPDLTPAQGGSKDMICGFNLRYLPANGVVRFDGKAPKFLPYHATNHTNKFRVSVHSLAGDKQKLLVNFDHFKE